MVKGEKEEDSTDDYWPISSIPKNVSKRNKNFRFTYRYIQCIIVYCGSKLETVVMLISHGKMMYSCHKTLWKQKESISTIQGALFLMNLQNEKRQGEEIVYYVILLLII